MSNSVQISPALDPKYIIRDPAEILCCSGKRVAVDTETTGLRWYQNEMIGVGFWCPDANFSGYFPCYTNSAKDSVYEAIEAWSRDTVVIMHNAKFDFHFLSLPPRNFETVIDTTILVHLIDSRFPKNAEWVEKWLMKTETKKNFVQKMGRMAKRIWDWPLNVVSEYCINDVRIEYAFAEILCPMVADLGLWKLFVKDMEFLKDVWDIEREGIELDVDFLERSIDVQMEHTYNLEEQLFDACGRRFNWRSSQQLSNAIYGGMGIPKPKNPFLSADGIDHSRFADAGLYKSTCTSTFLLTEKAKHPLGELIAALREADRMRKTMLGYLELRDYRNRVHANFNQSGTRTGRLSCGKPNLQNVPSHVRGRFTQSVYTGSTLRTEEYNLRNAFIAPPGMTFVSVDYKQMEARMFGILSQDPYMLEFLRNGQDVHGQVAGRVWGTKMGDPMYETHREWSKTISFGLIYGMTLGSLMFKLNMSKAQAAKVCDQYKAQFPRIDPWMNEIIQECKRNDYVRYWSGRIWREENLIDMYKGANAVIQGGCFDLLSVAELRVAEWLRNRNPLNKVINLVHDEIIYQCPTEDVVESSKVVAEIMTVPDIFEVPFITSVKVGPSYGSLDKIGATATEEPVVIIDDSNPFDDLSMGDDIPEAMQ